MLKLVETCQAIYAAFGRGDVPAILEHLADDVDWEYQPVAHDVPWLQPRRGRAGVGAFFQTVAEELEFDAFTVKTFLEGPGVVAVLVDLTATVKKTGRTIREVDEVHLWHFDERGRVVRFKHAADTAQHERAWRSA